MLLSLQNCVYRQNEINLPGKYHNVRLHTLRVFQRTHCLLNQNLPKMPVKLVPAWCIYPHTDLLL